MRGLMLALVFASPNVAAANCFTFSDDPSWVIYETEDGFTWKQADKVLTMTTSGAGTGISTRVAWDEAGEGHPYLYVGDSLVIDMQLYEPGCAQLEAVEIPTPRPPYTTD